jgi:hypothetical protein
VFENITLIPSCAILLLLHLCFFFGVVLFSPVSITDVARGNSMGKDKELFSQTNVF